MRLVSVPRTVASEDNILQTVIDTHFSPNPTVGELRDLIKAGAGIDPLMEFADA